MAGFSEASGFVKFTFALVVLAIACGIVGIASPAWAKRDIKATGTLQESPTPVQWEGLWDVCVNGERHAGDSTKTTMCQKIYNFADWLAAARCFAILGLLMLAVGGALIIAYVSHEPLQANKEVPVAFTLVFFFSCMCLVICIGVYGGKYMETYDLDKSSPKVIGQPYLDWAFGLTVGAAGLAFLAAIFSIPELQWSDRYSDYSDKRGRRGDRYRYPDRQGSFGPADRAYELNKYGPSRPPTGAPGYRY